MKARSSKALEEERQAAEEPSHEAKIHGDGDACAGAGYVCVSLAIS